MSRAVVLCLLAVILAASQAAAQDKVDTPFVRVEVTPDTVTVGQPVLLRIVVLAPTWFPKAPNWPSFEIANAIVRLPPNSSRSISERVDGATWAGVVRNYRLYPQIAGEFRITGQAIDTTYADPETRQPIALDVTVPDIVVTAVIPRGAETLDPLLIGKSLTLEQSIEGKTEDLQAGDAIVRTVTARIDGMPAVFLPSLLPPLDENGLSVMAQQPVAEDIQDEGTGDIKGATRTERVAYFFEAGGSFTLPAIELDWWNTETGAIETASAPAIVVDVAAAEGISDGGGVGLGIKSVSPWLLGGVAILIGLLLALIVTRHRIAAWRNDRRARYLESEKCAFLKLRSAIGHGNLSDIDRSLTTWLARSTPDAGHSAALSDVRDLMNRHFERRYGRGELSATLSTLDRRRLQDALTTARRQMRGGMSVDDDRSLPPRLNPA